MTQLPYRARAFVVVVVVAAAIAAYDELPVQIAHMGIFAMLMAAALVAAKVKLRLPLASGNATLSVSYTVDFASLILLGSGPAMIIAAFCACAQSTIFASRPNPRIRIVFNMASVVLSVYVAARTFALFGGTGESRALYLAKPFVAAVLTYYLTSTGLVATVVALTSGQSAWSTWRSSFLWTAPSYFVGAAAATAGAASVAAGHGWLLPIAVSPVYLTFRSYRIYLGRIAAERAHKEEVQRLHVEAVDALQAARESEERYALAAAGSNDGLWDWNVISGQFYVSARWKLMVGLPAERPVDLVEDWWSLVHKDDLPELRAALEQHFESGKDHFTHEYRVAHSTDMTWRSLLCRGVVVRDHAGRPVRMSGSQTDVTDWRRIQMHLARAASHDALTGLPNRRLFVELLDKILAKPQRPGHGFAVLFIDLDRFKYINDSLGHLVGDRFLVAVAERFQAQLRPGDVLARLGGDEFVVLVGAMTDPAIAVVVAERLQGALRDPLAIEGRDIYASASIGIAHASEKYSTAEDLLRAADTAMYRAKEDGRGRHRHFEPQMHVSAMGRLTLETELRRAITWNELQLNYQPIVDLQTREISGFEALVRWRRHDGSVIDPAVFIPVAEEAGLIAPMTRWVLQEACRQVGEWQRTFLQPLSLTVNISTKQFGDPRLIDDVRDAIEQHDIIPGTLRLEITESALMSSAESTMAQLEELRGMRVQLYLDDFGTGYSSLSYLQRYRVDALKIDRSFVSQITRGQGTPILGAIIELARKLGMGVVAEGVETTEQADRLCAMQCPQAQGYLFSHPLTPAGAYRALHAACRADVEEALSRPLLPVEHTVSAVA